MSCDTQDFSAERLRAMYRESLRQGYRPLLFGEEQGKPGPFILWRHDVDLELPAVVRMAELEAQEGIRSTYFFMTRSWFYNLFSWEGAAVVARLRELGHAVGLHCDLGLPRDAEPVSEDVENNVAREFALLDLVFPDVFSRTVSFHNPPRGILRRRFESFYSTYQAEFFGSIKYLSDSNRRWREGAPEEWFIPGQFPRLSILLHPEIWAYPGRTMPEGMAGFMATRTQRCRDMLIWDDVWVRPPAETAL